MTTEQLNELLDTYNIPKISVDFYNDHYICIPSKQLDTARYILITLTENGIPRHIKENERVSFRAEKPDNTCIHNDNECCIILEDGRLLLALTEQTLYVSGKIEADLQLTTADGKLYSTRKFYIESDSLPYDENTVESSNEFNTLNRLIAEENKRIETIIGLEDAGTASESIRQEQESVRQKQEETRQEQESLRKTNEGNRILAEAGRENDTNLAVAAANNAAGNANHASNNAISSGEAADLATANANQVTQKANTVIEEMRSLIADDNIIHINKLGMPNGVAALDQNGTVPASQLPSFVDDAIEGTAREILVDEITGTKTAAGFTLADGNECIPESGKIYIDITDNVTYRWSGSIFTSIGSSLALGTTANTAFPGNRGLALEDHAAALEELHNNLSADQIRYNNTGTTLLSANLQDAVTELTAEATQTKSGLMSYTDKKRVENYADIKQINITLSAARWTDHVNFYSQSLPIEDISIYNNCCITVSPSITPLQESAVIDADFTDIKYNKTSGITFTASGIKPLVDIPFVLNIGTSMNCVEIPNYLGTYGTAKEISFDNADTNLSGQTVQDTMKEVDTILNTHAQNNNAHITEAERTTWNAKASAAHTHDDRYYTEAEINNLLSAKTSTYLPLAGGTMLGQLKWNAGNFNNAYALGMNFHNSSENINGGIGGLGTAGSWNSMHLGLGENWWSFGTPGIHLTESIMKQKASEIEIGYLYGEGNYTDTVKITCGANINTGFIVYDKYHTGKTMFAVWKNNNLEPYIAAPPVYSVTTTGAANVCVNSIGVLARSTASSKRYKENIRKIEETAVNPKNILKIPIVLYDFKEGYVTEKYTNHDSRKNVVGIIAEDVAEYFPEGAEYTTERNDETEEETIIFDRPENWNIRIMFPALLFCVQEQEKNIEKLQKENQELKDGIQTLREEMNELRKIVLDKLSLCE